jgi:hypothetical protein
VPLGRPETKFKNRESVLVLGAFPGPETTLFPEAPPFLLKTDSRSLSRRKLRQRLSMADVPEMYGLHICTYRGFETFADPT